MRDTLVNWFIANQPALYQDMLASSHCVDPLVPNPFHAEGSVWTHTMMVMTWVQAHKSSYSPHQYLVLLTSALLHDIGKPSCQELKPATPSKPSRYAFHGHEGVSVFLAISILQDLQRDFPAHYTDIAIEQILTVIGTHGLHYDQSSSEYLLRHLFRQADKSGAIRNTTVGDYEPQRFATHRNPQPGKTLTILCGLPCSGKSTYAATLPGLVVSRDELIHSISNQPDYNLAYEWCHSTPERKALLDSAFERQLHQAASHDHIVIDMTMLSIKDRRSMLTRFPRHQASLVLFLPSLPTIYTRNTARPGKFIPSQVYDFMTKRFTFPTLEEGFDSINIII